MRYLDDHGRHSYVDDPENCKNHHGKSKRDRALLYHVHRNGTTTPIVVRCPSSLTDEEKRRLKENGAK